MPIVADYKVIREEKFTLQQLLQTGQLDVDPVNFNLDLPDVESRSIVAFKIDLVNADQFHFSVDVNGTVLLSRIFTGARSFTYHAVIPTNVLLGGSNTITFNAKSPTGGGSAEISDIVLWYRRRV